jgi:hypothetical protein
MTTEYQKTWSIRISLQSDQKIYLLMNQAAICEAMSHDNYKSL